MVHCMIDMETLDTQPSCVILSIGAVLFNVDQEKFIKTLELKPTIEDQTDIYKRTISEATLSWWSNQNSEAINEAFEDNNRLSFKECMEQLYKFCWNTDRVWSNGASFDIVVAENAWQQLDMRIPWRHFNIRDTRTLFEIAGVSLKDNNHIIKHKALDDAIHQVKVVQLAYKKIKQSNL